MIELFGLAAFFAALFIYGLVLLVYYDRLNRWVVAGGRVRRILYHVFAGGASGGPYPPS